MQDAFRALDLNKDGKVDNAEFVSAIRSFNLPIPEMHVWQIAAALDVNGDGIIDFNEFATALRR